LFKQKVRKIKKCEEVNITVEFELKERSKKPTEVLHENLPEAAVKTFQVIPASPDLPANRKLGTSEKQPGKPGRLRVEEKQLGKHGR